MFPRKNKSKGVLEMYLMFANKFNYLSNYHNFISEKHNNNKNLDVLCYFNKYQYLVQYSLIILMFLSMGHD